MMWKILLIVLAVLAGLFLLSLIVYFFNLDMKLAAAMTPVMNKIYDRGKAKRDRKARARKEREQQAEQKTGQQAEQKTEQKAEQKTEQKEEQKAEKKMEKDTDRKTENDKKDGSKAV